MRVLSIGLMLALVAGAPQSPRPARDAQVDPTFGSAMLSGVVVDDREPAQPVRRAIVRLTGEGLRPSRGGITDDEGRFTFAALPAGRVTLSAQRATFITSEYGAKRPGRPGTPIAVADGQHVTVELRIWRGAVVSGVVFDEAGAPVEGVRVSAIPSRRVASTALTLSNNGALTNDRGEYRLFGLLPGTYIVGADPDIPGTGDVAAPSESEVDAALAALRAGRDATISVDAARPPDPPPFEDVELTPIYHPSTPVPTQASQVRLLPGHEASGIHITLQAVATAVVDGAVYGSDGRPANRAWVRFTEASASPIFKALAMKRIIVTGEDGVFRVTGVMPGDYQIVAHATPTGNARGPILLDPRQPLSWAAATVSTTGQDVTGLRLDLQPAFSVSGRMIFDGTTSPPEDLDEIGVTLQTTDLAPGALVTIANGVPNANFVPPVRLQDDGAFQVARVTPDTYRILVSGEPLDDSSWWLRSAVIDGRDVLDEPFVVAGAGDVTGLVLTMSDRRTELSGTLQTPAGEPASEVFVIAFPAERGYWRPGSRRVRAVRPASDGRFVIAGLPPGRYLLGALSDVEEGEWDDPAFLEQLAAASIALSLAEGQQIVQDIRIAR